MSTQCQLDHASREADGGAGNPFSSSPPKATKSGLMWLAETLQDQ
jgi:hypothetical protein